MFTMTKDNELDTEKVDPRKEIAAMETIAEVLNHLDNLARTRVLRWVVDRFDPQLTPSARAARAINPSAGRGDRHVVDLASLYSRAAPSTEAERALLVSYWLQVHNGEEEFTGAAINKELRNLGDEIGNITQAFNKLMTLRPAWAVQTRKSGKSQQARKLYKLTAPGIAKAEEMLRGGRE